MLYRVVLSSGKYIVNSSTCLFGIWSEVRGLGPGTRYLRTVAVSYGVRYFGDTTCEASSVVLCSNPSLWHCAVRGVFVCSHSVVG